MADSTSVSIGFNTKEAKQEISTLSAEMKKAQNEFKLADTTLKTTGSTLDRLTNKSQTLTTQLQKQGEITKKCEQMVQHYATAQESARDRVAKAAEAYEKNKDKLKDNEKELKKYTDELDKAKANVKNMDKQYAQWNEKLSKSKLAEAELRNELKQTNEALQKQKSYIAQVKDEYSRLHEKTAGLQSGLTSAGRTLTTHVTAPLIAMGAYATKQIGTLNKELANIGTLSVPTERLQEFKKGIQDVAIATGKSTSDISDGTYQVVSAFGDAADTMEKVEINAKAAKAGLATTTDSINLTSAVTKAYGDTSAAAVQKVADLAFKTVELGQTTFPELASSMGQVTSSSKALGVSQEELFTTFATLTGVTGSASEVATQLKAIYTALEKPSTNMQKAIQKLGYSSGYTMINTLGLAGTLDALMKATDGSDEALMELFSNQRAIPAILALTGAQYDTFNEKLGKMENASGAATKAFEVQTEGVAKTGFQFEQAMIKMQVAAQNFGEAAAPFIAKAADAVSGLADWLNEIDEGDRERLIKVGIALAALGPSMSIASKGITVFQGSAAAIKTVAKIFGSTATAATGAATATTEVAGAAATASEAMSTVAAVSEATTAAIEGVGVAGEAAGIGMSAAVAPLAAFAAGLAGTYAIAKISSKAIDKYYDNLIESGNEALEQAKDYQNKVKASYDLSDEAKTVKEYYDRYSELKQLQESGTIISDEKAELKEIEQWFIDHYGEYISAEEQKNGVRQESIDFIKQITEAEKERADAEAKAARTEIGKNSGEKRANAEKAKQEIPQLQARNDTFKQQIQDAQKLEINLGTLKAKYEAINNTMNGAERIKAVHQLVEDNQDIFDSYARLTGGQISFDDIEGSISNLTGKTEEWQKSIDLTDEQIIELKGSIEAYKDALIVLQDTVTEDALKKNGFTSLSELFSSGDSAAIERAINSVVVKCKSLGMTTEETALQVGLFRNGFSNLNEAMASGDKAMKAVVDNMNEYMHAVVGLPEDVQFTVNAEGDIDIINTAEEGITELDGSEAEAKVKVDSGDSEETVTTLQELIDKYGASKAVALLEADDNATVTINGVSYRLTEYDKEKGVAILTADDGEAIIKIDTTTGAVRDFSKEKGTARLDVDNSAAISKISDITNRIKNLVAQPFTAKLSASGIAGNASGTQNAEGGPAIINDQAGVADNRELVEHKGRYYLFNGKNIVVDLDKHDKVFTAAQTKKMLDGIPHFATGSNNKSFETAKSNFEYRQKTSVVTDDEALLWWKKVLEDYAKDADVVREANIEIYELTNKINDDAIKDYKNRIKKQESASKDWIDYEVKMHNLSIDEQIAAYGRMDDNYRSTLDEMTANTTMTAEELEEVWSEYYDTVRDHEMKIADLRKKNLDDLQKQSLSYIEERTYYNDWENQNDSPEAAYERIKERNSEALLAGDITNDEYIAKMTEAGQKLYEGRLANSKKWLEQQYKYGAISEEEYRAGLQRVKDYTEQYYKEGLISGIFYYEALDDANNELFDNMSATLEAYVNEYYEKQKAMLQARRAEIEAEYDAQDAAEKKADRAKELSDLQAQYKKYQNAVTIEGRKKLQEIQDNIDSLRKEEQKEAREAEKQSRLDELDKENDRIEEEQEQSLKGISKYTAQALGIISGGNDEMISKFNSVVESYNAQQAQLAKNGYDTISKIVDMTNAKLAEIGQNMQSAPVRGGDFNLEVNQTFHQSITDETTAMAYGKYAGAAVRNLKVGDIALGRWDI